MNEGFLKDTKKIVTLVSVRVAEIGKYTGQLIKRTGEECLPCSESLKRQHNQLE